MFDMKVYYNNNTGEIITSYVGSKVLSEQDLLFFMKSVFLKHKSNRAWDCVLEPLPIRKPKISRIYFNKRNCDGSERL